MRPDGDARWALWTLTLFAVACRGSAPASLAPEAHAVAVAPAADAAATAEAGGAGSAPDAAVASAEAARGAAAGETESTGDGGESRPGGSGAPRPVPPPTRGVAGAASCIVDEPVTLGTVEGRLQSMGLAFGPGGGLAAWPLDREQAQVVPLDGAGHPSGPAATVAIPSANRIFGLAAVGERFLLMTHNVCPDQRYYHKCLHLLALGADGQPLGPVATDDTEGWIDVAGLAATADAVLLLRGHIYARCALSRYRVAGDGTVHAEVLRGFEDMISAGAFHDLHGLAVDGERWFVLAFADQRPIGEFLVTADGKVRVEGLPPAFEVHALEWDRDALAMIAAEGDARPLYARVGLDGRLVEPHRRIERGEAPPAPFAERVAGELELTAGKLRLVRRSLAHDALGPATEVARPRGSLRDPPPRALAWSGESFAATFGDYEGTAWSVRAARVRCGGEAAGPQESRGSASLGTADGEIP